MVWGGFQSVFRLLINHFVKQRSHVTLYLCISYWNLIVLVKIKLIKFIVAEPPPLTSGTSQSRYTIIGTVTGFLILVVGGLLFGIIIIRRRRNGNGKKTLVAGNEYGGSWCSGLGDGSSIVEATYWWRCVLDLHLNWDRLSDTWRRVKVYS
jgi:hypothetical protein